MATIGYWWDVPPLEISCAQDTSFLRRCRLIVEMALATEGEGQVFPRALLDTGAPVSIVSKKLKEDEHVKVIPLGNAPLGFLGQSEKQYDFGIIECRFRCIAGPKLWTEPLRLPCHIVDDKILEGVGEVLLGLSGFAISERLYLPGNKEEMFDFGVQTLGITAAGEGPVKYEAAVYITGGFSIEYGDWRWMK